MSSTNPIDLATAMQPTADTPAVQATAESRSWLDRIGISASVLCAIHCLAAPFILLLLPAAGAVWAHPAVHWVLAVLVVPLALWVLYNGYRKHGNRLTIVAATIGTLLILAGLIAPEVSSKPLVSFTVPSLFGGSDGAPAAAAEPACTEACCPTISQSATGGTLIAMPPGGLLTMIGSLFLVLAHSSNLIACRCFSKAHGCGEGGESPCGCPA